MISRYTLAIEDFTDGYEPTKWLILRRYYPNTNTWEFETGYPLKSVIDAGRVEEMFKYVNKIQHDLGAAVMLGNE